ncbi:MAG TPA: dCMP deaminase family protein [Candidatus Woesebacteria bacterium]|jgi:dCMP deaminase|nr:dCMP deaminase family protein [Candidatus Woesebacteria bacterium]HNS94702.1 dCMP deaminase family protein [Candidatus Woesebacteria bacterium]
MKKSRVSSAGSPQLPDWHQYFMQIARVVKSRGNCVLYQVGAVLVQGRQIIATGYNGTPRGLPNCIEGGCARCKNKKTGKIRSGEHKGTCLCVHAEVNAILQCAYHGISTKGATLYSTTSPCMLCAKEMLNAGIIAVYYEYEDSGERESLTLLKKHMKEVVLLVP